MRFRGTCAVILGLAGLAPASAVAALCTATSSGTWGPIGAGTAGWSCGTPSASDGIVIPNGITVSVVDDVAQDATVGIGVRVESGGTLEADVSSTTGRLNLDVGVDGLLCDPGSTCNFRGVYREANVSSPGLLADPDPGEYFVLGYPDLGSGGSTVRVEFPANKGFHLDSLSAIVAGDVLCFFDPDPSDTAVPQDVNYCYEVTAVDWAPISGAPYFELDVRQGAADHAASPLTRRDVFQDELASAALAGDRTLSLTSGSLTGHGTYAGRHLRFEDPQGVPEHRSYRILSSRSAGDTLTLGDARGLETAYAAGTRIWIDYGWRPGDPFFVMVPVVIGSGTSIAVEQSDSWIRPFGTVALRAVLLDAVSRLDLEGATATQFQDVWLRDPGAEANQAVNFNELAADITIDHLTITGIDETQPRSHSIYARDSTSVDYDITLNDVAIRHHGDDCWSMGLFIGDVTIDRFRCQFVSGNAESTNLLSFAGHSGNTMVVDAECVDCLSADSLGTTDKVIAPSDAGVGSASGVLSWGSEGQFGSISAGTQSHSDFLMIGGTSNRAGTILPEETTGCVVREFTAAGTTATTVAFNNRNVSNCVFRDVTVDFTAFLDAGYDGLVENVAIINPDTIYSASDASVIEARLNTSVTDDIQLHRITIAWMPGIETQIDRVLYLRSSMEVGDVYELHGITIAGHDIDEGQPNGSPNGILASSNQATDADWGNAGPCLIDNDNDLSAGIALSPPASIVQNTALGFVDEATGRFDTTAGSVSDLNGCGVDRGVAAPGIHGYRWMHAISGIAPEMLADDPDGDGIVSDPSAGVCTGGAGSGCSDNCPAVFNPAQADGDADSIGDACDLACQDGTDNDGDTAIDVGSDTGCTTATDPFEEVQDATSIVGEASGGDIDFTVSGVLLTVPTSAGQTAEQVALALSAAINADPILSLWGVTAVATGNLVETNGSIDSIVFNDPGVGPPPVFAPGLSAGPALGLALLLVALGVHAIAPQRRHP